MRNSIMKNRSSSIPKVTSTEEIEQTQTLNILDNINNQIQVKSEIVIAGKKHDFSPRNLAMQGNQIRRDSLFKNMEKK